MLNVLMKKENTKEAKEICGGDVQTHQDVYIH